MGMSMSMGGCGADEAKRVWGECWGSIGYGGVVENGGEG